MRASAVAGIVFANTSDNFLKKLTSRRSMASVPIAARYRLIEFALSNLVNAGINSVAIITKENYRSLMDHVGNGAPWELDRKNGGGYLLPPYLTSGVKRYNGTVDALYGARDYVARVSSEYIVLYDAHNLANIDVASALDNHIERNADISIVYHKGVVSPDEEHSETMLLKLDSDDNVTAISFDPEKEEKANYSLGITIIGRELLTKLVFDAAEAEKSSFNREVIARKVKNLKIVGFEHKEYVAVMNNTHSYFNANMDTLKKEVRSQLFNKQRPIYTKTRDDMPTRYGTKSKVKNCSIGDGCIIEGTVTDSILFRGVKVAKGAVVSNCILMQETSVGADAQLSNVIADKNVTISDKLVLQGSNKKHLYIKKNQIV